MNKSPKYKEQRGGDPHYSSEATRFIHRISPDYPLSAVLEVGCAEPETPSFWRGKRKSSSVMAKRVILVEGEEGCSGGDMLKVE